MEHQSFSMQHVYMKGLYFENTLTTIKNITQLNKLVDTHTNVYVQYNCIRVVDYINVRDVMYI